MSRARLRAGLAVALLLTLGAAWYAPAEETADAMVSAPVAPRRAAPRPAAPAELDVLAIRARGEEEGESDAGLFAPTEWTPGATAAATAAPAAAPAPAPEPAPQLPPLPFRVLGSHEQGGKTTVFLQQNERNHVVRVGDVIDDTYKVESIDGASMKLRYLPLDQVQTLELGRMLKEM
jgi:hypothetical protein